MSSIFHTHSQGALLNITSQPEEAEHGRGEPRLLALSQLEKWSRGQGHSLWHRGFKKGMGGVWRSKGRLCDSWLWIYTALWASLEPSALQQS
jgi:hypothetical protein